MNNTDLKAKILDITERMISIVNEVYVKAEYFCPKFKRLHKALPTFYDAVKQADYIFRSYKLMMENMRDVLDDLLETYEDYDDDAYDLQAEIDEVLNVA